MTRQQQAPGITGALARYAVQARYAALPDPVRREAARAWLNWMGCALGGCREPAVQLAVETVAELGGGRPYSDHRERLWEDVVAESGSFEPLEYRSVPHEQSGTPELIVERTRSTSFIAALPPDRHQHVLDEVAELVATHPDTRGLDRITIPYNTKIYWCRLRA